MHRLIVGISFCLLLSCAPSPRETIDLDQLSFHRLTPEELLFYTDKKKEEYENAREFEKPHLELALGYLYYQQQKLAQAQHYLLKVWEKKDFLLKEYAAFYLGRILLDQNQCAEVEHFRNLFKNEYTTSPMALQFDRLWQESLCKPKPETHPKTKKEKLAKIKRDLYEAALENYKKKDYAKAIPLFKKFLWRATPNHPEVENVMVRLAIIYKRLDQKNEYLKMLVALSRYRWASKQFRYNPKWVFEIAKFYWNLEKIILARKYVKKLIAWPYHRYMDRCYFILAKIEAENKNFSKAAEFLREASKYSIAREREEEMAYLQGWYLYRSKNYKDAIDAFVSFKTTYPESDFIERVTYWLGRSYATISDTPNARLVFESIVQKNPYSYYGILSSQRLGQNREALVIGHQISLAFPQDDSLKSLSFQKAKELIEMGLGEEGGKELNILFPLLQLSENPWEFQYYIAALYSVAGDHFSSFSILNNLHKVGSSKLPKEHLRILYPKRYWPIIQKYADQFKIDPYLLLSTMRQESAFDAKAISPADAYGLLQITPYMAKVMGKKLGRPLKNSDELLDPETNILYCSYYISELLQKHKGNLILALANYNSNDSAVKKWKERYWVPDPEEFIEEIPYAETRNYVKFVLRNYTNNLYLYEGVFRAHPPFKL